MALNKITDTVLSIVGNTKETKYEDDTTIFELDDSDVQNSDGAPVEGKNPLGYNLDYTTAFYMALQGIIGTGIFLTPATIVKSIGSIGASYLLWIGGWFIAMFEISVYIEFSTYFKRRSGGDVAYLEQAYPKPKYLIPTAYAAVTVILSYTTSSAVAFGTYILSAAGAEDSTWNQRGVGVGVLTFVCLVSALNTRLSLRLSNFLGFVKVVFLFFIVITGFVVLGGGTKIKNPHNIFKNTWEGSTSDGNAISNAIIKVSFSYGGTQYLFGLVGESNPRQTKKMFRYFLPGTMLFVFIIYILSLIHI